MPARPGRPYSLSLWWPPSSCLPPSCVRLLCHCCRVPGKTGSGSWRIQKIATLLWPCGPPGQWATCLTPSQGVTHTCWKVDTRVSHNKNRHGCISITGSVASKFTHTAYEITVRKVQMRRGCNTTLDLSANWGYLPTMSADVAGTSSQDTTNVDTVLKTGTNTTSTDG